MFEARRRRFGRDVIDLVYLHRPHKGKELRPVLAGLEEAHGNGWLRLIGVSNFTRGQLALGSEAARIDAHRIGYSLLWRWPEEEVIPFCVDHGIAFVAYTPLGQGLLPGKVGRETSFAPDDPHPRTLSYDEAVLPHVLEAVERLKGVAEARGTGLLQAALGWVLRLGGVAGAIAVVKSVAQLRGTFTAEPVPGRSRPRGKATKTHGHTVRRSARILHEV